MGFTNNMVKIKELLEPSSFKVAAVIAVVVVVDLSN